MWKWSSQRFFLVKALLKISEGELGREIEDNLVDETIDRSPQSMYQRGAYWMDGGFHEVTESDSEETPEVNWRNLNLDKRFCDVTLACENNEFWPIKLYLHAVNVINVRSKVLSLGPTIIDIQYQYQWET